MSDSISTNGRAKKSTCRKCQRTVVVVTIEARLVEVDPEIINTVPIDGAPAFVMSRRAHADLCERYQEDARKARLREESRAHKRGGSFGRGRGERPKGGRREPGQ